MEEFFKTIAGVWRGDEMMWVDPGAKDPMKAQARFDNKILMGGNAIGADYVQTVGGNTSIECFTLIRSLDDKDSVEWIWAAKGQPRREFHGSIKNRVVVAEGEADGVISRFTQDYSVAGEMKTTSMIVTPDGTEMKVFEGHYHRLADTGAIGWRDLTVDNAEDVRDFYAAIVGWEAEAVSMGDYADFNMKSAAGEAIAGVCHKRGENADLPSQWLMYVTVADLEKSIAEAKRLGGEVVAGPRGLAGGQFAVVKDPAGAVLAIWQQ